MGRDALDKIPRRAVLTSIASAALSKTTVVASNARTVLPAKPEPFVFERSKTAVLVVDMQNDFAAKGGFMDRLGVDISIIRRAIPPTARVLAAARRNGIRVVYLKMGYRPDLSDLGAEDSPCRVRNLKSGVGAEVRAPNGRLSRILVRDTWNTEILPELTPLSGDTIIYKTRFSGFYQTDLDSALKKMGIKFLIVVGCTTSICIESTIRDAMFRDYLSVLLTDCTGEPYGYGLARSNHEASLLLIESEFGWLSDSGELVRVISSRP